MLDVSTHSRITACHLSSLRDVPVKNPTESSNLTESSNPTFPSLESTKLQSALSLTLPGVRFTAMDIIHAGRTLSSADQQLLTAIAAPLALHFPSVSAATIATSVVTAQSIH